MTKNLFLTTAIVTASFVANSALAETITERQVIESDDTETFTNITANGINSDGFKGGVIYNEGIFTITGTSNFVNNTAKEGGVIYNNRDEVIDPSDYTNPEAMSVKIQGASFTDNKAEYSGGVIFNNKGSMSISNSTLNNNQTGDLMAYGGAIYNNSHGIMIISDSTINNNLTANSGGAIYNSGTLTITGNSSFSGNKFRNYDIPELNDIFNVGTLNLITEENKIIFFASGLNGNGGNDRGTINISGNGKVHVENELIYHDVNLDSGILELASGTSAEATSIIIANGATLKAIGVTFSDQTSEDDGASISNGGTANISDAEFKKNKVAFEGYSTDYGGAINNEGGTMTISNATFTNNQVVRLDGDGENVDTGTKYGGAISNREYSEMSISGATFSGNKTIAYPYA